MNSLKLNGLAAAWYFVEKFHARPPRATRATQNARLLSVEFTVCFLPTTAGDLILRVSLRAVALWE
jgi:hypothetical protein